MEIHHFSQKNPHPNNWPTLPIFLDHSYKSSLFFACFFKKTPTTQFPSSFLLSYVNCPQVWNTVWRIWGLELKTSPPPQKKCYGKSKIIFIVLQIIYWSSLLIHILLKGYLYNHMGQLLNLRKKNYMNSWWEWFQVSFSFKMFPIFCLYQKLNPKCR